MSLLNMIRRQISGPAREAGPPSQKPVLPDDETEAPDPLAATPAELAFVRAHTLPVVRIMKPRLAPLKIQVENARQG